MKPDIATDDFRAKTYDVFISYKRGENDDAACQVLVDALEAAGYDVFWDTKLNHDDWKGQLRDQINRCGIVICIWPQRSANSKYVEAEAYHAFGIEKLLSAPIENMPVVPVYFQGTNIHPFDGWADESKRKAQIAKMLDTLERVTGGPSRKHRVDKPLSESTLAAPIPAITGATASLPSRKPASPPLNLPRARPDRLAARRAE
jgi:hypothetical protein